MKDFVLGLSKGTALVIETLLVVVPLVVGVVIADSVAGSIVTLVAVLSGFAAAIWMSRLRINNK